MNKLNCHVIGSYLFEWIRGYAVICIVKTRHAVN